MLYMHIKTYNQNVQNPLNDSPNWVKYSSFWVLELLGGFRKLFSTIWDTKVFGNFFDFFVQKHAYYTFPRKKRPWENVLFLLLLKGSLIAFCGCVNYVAQGPWGQTRRKNIVCARSLILLKKSPFIRCFIGQLLLGAGCCPVHRGVSQRRIVLSPSNCAKLQFTILLQLGKMAAPKLF